LSAGTEITRKPKDATDFSSKQDEAAAREALQQHALKLREDPQVVRSSGQQGESTASRSLTDVSLVAFRDGEGDAKQKEGAKTTERRSDGATVTRDEKGLVRSVDDGKRHFDYEYLSENGEVKRNAKGEPLVSKVTVRMDGKTQTFDAAELLKSGNNSLGKIDAEAVTIDQKGDLAGKVRLRSKDGSSAELGFAAKPDGSIVARMDMVTEANGSTHAFEYKKVADPTFVTKCTDTVTTFDGKTQVSTNTRVMETDSFVRKDADGTERYITDLKINEHGQLLYRGNESLDKALDDIFGQSWLISGDLEAAMAQFSELALSKGLFKGDAKQLEAVLDRFVARCQKQGEVGVKQPSDDQIAATFRHLSAIYESASTVLTGAALHNAVEKCLLSLSNPQQYCNQGQIGSCYLNSLLFLGEVGSPDRVAKAFSSVVRTGKFRGMEFDTSDTSPLAGQDRFNHIMTSLLGKTFGFRHMTPSFRGTCQSEADTASLAAFGVKYPAFNLGTKQDKKAFDAAIAKYGGVVVYTLGGCHAQVISKDSKGRYRLENWWNGEAGMEGTISEQRLFRS
jgi:hypothetical protein